MIFCLYQFQQLYVFILQFVFYYSFKNGPNTRQCFKHFDQGIHATSKKINHQFDWAELKYTLSLHKIDSEENLI